MGRDYAHRDNGGRQTSGRGGMPGWAWLLLGIAIGFVGAVGYYISRPTEAQAALEPLEKAKAGGKKKITIPPKEPSRFAFYELLPNYEVVIPKESLKKDARPAPGAAPAESSPGR